MDYFFSLCTAEVGCFLGFSETAVAFRVAVPEERDNGARRLREEPPSVVDTDTDGSDACVYMPVVLSRVTSPKISSIRERKCRRRCRLQEPRPPLAVSSLLYLRHITTCLWLHPQNIYLSPDKYTFINTTKNPRRRSATCRDIFYFSLPSSWIMKI